MIVATTKRYSHSAAPSSWWGLPNMKEIVTFRNKSLAVFGKQRLDRKLGPRQRFVPKVNEIFRNEKTASIWWRCAIGFIIQKATLTRYCNKIKIYQIRFFFFPLLTFFHKLCFKHVLQNWVMEHVFHEPIFLRLPSGNTCFKNLKIIPWAFFSKGSVVINKR